MTNIITISSVAIRQDAQGRYSLNDLHKAAVKQGATERTTEPGKFLSSPKITDLCAELQTDTQNLGIDPTNTVRGGVGQGTYVCKELVYAYAMWISAKFHLEVIRAYDAQATEPPQPAATAIEQDLRVVGILADLLRVAPSGRIAMAQVVLAQSAPHLLPALPGYAVDAPPSAIVSGSSLPTASATDLLKRHGLTISAMKFNERLSAYGMLEQQARTSRGNTKHYWSVTEKGSEFGKNITSNQNARETQPHWYVERFPDLLRTCFAS